MLRPCNGSSSIPKRPRPWDSGAEERSKTDFSWEREAATLVDFYRERLGVGSTGKAPHLNAIWTFARIAPARERIE